MGENTSINRYMGISIPMILYMLLEIETVIKLYDLTVSMLPPVFIGVRAA